MSNPDTQSRKPSDVINDRLKTLRDEFKKENPYFFTDHGYWPDFKFQAILDWLDAKAEELHE